jgi:hypothetical protein
MAAETAFASLCWDTAAQGYPKSLKGVSDDKSGRLEKTKFRIDPIFQLNYVDDDCQFRD